MHLSSIRTSVQRLALSGIVTAVSQMAYAGSTLHIPDDPSQLHQWTVSYSAPNETEVQQGQPIFAEAPPGVGFSVGFERSNFAAIMAPQMTDLVFVDSDPVILTLATLNRLLLVVASRDRVKYARLRLHSTFAEWQDAARLAELPESDRVALTSENFKLWVENIRDDRGLEIFDHDYNNPDRFGSHPDLTGRHGENEYQCVSKLKMSVLDFRLLSRPEQIHMIIERTGRTDVFAWLNDPHLDYKFGRNNYLQNDAAYQRLSDLAINGHMHIAAANLFNRDRVQVIVNALVSAGLKLSFLDISNAWDINYPTSANDLAHLMDAFTPVATEDSLLVLTREKWTGMPESANYRAYRFKKIAPELWQKLVLGELIKASPEIERIFNGPGYPNAQYNETIRARTLVNVAKLTDVVKPGSQTFRVPGTIDYTTHFFSCAGLLRNKLISFIEK